jgi:LemA protein
MTPGQIAWLAAAAVLVFWMLGAYNRLVALRNAIGSAWQAVDEVLRRRGAAVVALAAALRQTMAAEVAALDALLAGQAQVAAAADALGARPVRASAAAPLVLAESALTSASARVLALLDLQPDLADSGVAPHAAALRAAEPQLAFARQNFNAAVATYNEAARQFPTRLVARTVGFGTAGRI